MQSDCIKIHNNRYVFCQIQKMGYITGLVEYKDLVEYLLQLSCGQFLMFLQIWKPHSNGQNTKNAFLDGFGMATSLSILMVRSSLFFSHRFSSISNGALQPIVALICSPSSIFPGSLTTITGAYWTTLNLANARSYMHRLTRCYWNFLALKSLHGLSCILGVAMAIPTSGSGFRMVARARWPPTILASSPSYANCFRIAGRMSKCLHCCSSSTTVFWLRRYVRNLLLLKVVDWPRILISIIQGWIFDKKQNNYNFFVNSSTFPAMSFRNCYT